MLTLKITLEENDGKIRHIYGGKYCYPAPVVRDAELRVMWSDHEEDYYCREAAIAEEGADTHFGEEIALTAEDTLLLQTHGVIHRLCVSYPTAEEYGLPLILMDCYPEFARAYLWEHHRFLCVPPPGTPGWPEHDSHVMDPLTLSGEDTRDDSTSRYTATFLLPQEISDKITNPKS